MIVVPIEQLSDEVVSALIEEFVTRHGAVQGEDVSLEVKSGQVRRLLKEGKAVIVFDEETESATVVMKDELKRWDGRVIERDDSQRQMKDEW